MNPDLYNCLNVCVCSIFLMIIEREYRTNSHEVESNDFPCTCYLKTKVSINLNPEIFGTGQRKSAPLNFLKFFKINLGKAIIT